MVGAAVQEEDFRGNHNALITLEFGERECRDKTDFYKKQSKYTTGTCSVLIFEFNSLQKITFFG